MSLDGDHVTKKSNLILIETILFHVGKKLMFLEMIKNSAHGLHLRLTGVFGIAQNIVQIHNNKQVELLGKDHVDVALEAGRSIGEFDRHDWMLH